MACTPVHTSMLSDRDARNNQKRTPAVPKPQKAVRAVAVHSTAQVTAPGFTCPAAAPAHGRVKSLQTPAMPVPANHSCLRCRLTEQKPEVGAIYHRHLKNYTGGKPVTDVILSLISAVAAHPHSQFGISHVRNIISSYISPSAITFFHFTSEPAAACGNGSRTNQLLSSQEEAWPVHEPGSPIVLALRAT
jgi:hypothetical protein